MNRLYHMTLLSLTALSLSACGRHTPQSAAPAAPVARAEPAVNVAKPGDVLSHLVERYWQENSALAPWHSWGGAETRFGESPTEVITPQALADSLALERRYLADLLSLARAPLDADAKLTYDLFRRERQLSIDSYTYPSELLPVNAYESMPQRFAFMASAAEQQALASTRDFDLWQSRAQVYTQWTNQAIGNLRDGIRRGYTLPVAVVERTLTTLAALGEDAPSSVFYQTLRTGSEAVGEAERARLNAAVRNVVKDTVLPAYRLLHDFLQREYLPRARVSVGLSALPLGQAWYAYLIRRTTDGVQTPAELHSLGVAEVEHLHARIQALLSETAFAGNAQGFIDSVRSDPRYLHTADDLSAAYQELKVQVAAAMPTLFSSMPHADFDIRSVDSFWSATAPGLIYRRSMASGRQAAVLYVNTTDLEARPAIAAPALYLREAVPGHHYQLALQQESADLPRFRRFGGAPAFIQGWGLYAASLGEELGVYHDAQAKFGSLLAQLECAAGMVIDTGIHAQQWTRTQALDYLHAQVPLDDIAAANAVDRVLALPGDALSCMVGFLKIQALRVHAQQTLGARFHLSAFHTELLKNGAIPLDLLEAEVKQWVEAVPMEEAAPEAAAAPLAAPAGAAAPEAD